MFSISICQGLQDEGYWYTIQKQPHTQAMSPGIFLGDTMEISGSTARGAVSLENECFQLLKCYFHVIIPIKYIIFL